MSKSKAKTRTPKKKPPRPAAQSTFWDLKLYIAGRTVQSEAALGNLKRLCEERFKGHFHLEVIDLLQHPHRAKVDQIVAIPTLVRKLPAPMKKIIGDLSNTSQVLLWGEICGRIGK